MPTIFYPSVKKLTTHYVKHLYRFPIHRHLFLKKLNILCNYNTLLTLKFG